MDNFFWIAQDALLHPPIDLQVLFTLLVGFCVGSFLNVVIYRLPRSRSLHFPRSRCGYCDSTLHWWMNIPVFSFLMTGGSCSHCGYAYSIRYLIVEILNAVLYLSVWSVHGWTLGAVLFCAASSLFLAVSFIDLEFRIIPDSMSLGAWAFVMFLAALPIEGSPLQFTQSLIGSLVGYSCFWLMSRAYYWWRQEEGLGGGDVKFMGLVGALLGVSGVLTTIAVGALLGSFVGILFMILYRKTRNFPIPFGPFLAIGALVCVLHIDDWLWGLI